MPLIETKRSHRWKWVFIALASAWILLAWWVDDRRGWFSQVYPLVLAVQIHVLFVSRRILAGGVLAIMMGNGTVTRIPLAAAEVTRKGAEWHLRWPEGRRFQRKRFKFPEPFGLAVERAVLSAKEAPQGTVPATVKDAEKALTFGVLANRWHWYIIAGLFGAFLLFGLSIWIDNPLPLLGVLVLLFLAASQETKRVMFACDHLWLLPEQGEPHGIPLRAIHAYVEKGGVFVVKTEDPAHPEIRLNATYSPDLIRQLKKRLNGEPEGPYGPGVLPTTPETQPGARCTLCGRPDPGGAKPGPVYICETCSGRARVQATETGHGLPAKDPKPM